MAHCYPERRRHWKLRELPERQRNCSIWSVPFLLANAQRTSSPMLIARLWSDASVMTIAKAFSDTPKMSNIEPTLQFVRDLGWRSCLITLSPMFFASECRAWGFDFIFGSQFEKRSHPFVVGPPLNILRPEDKVLIAERLCVQLGATLESCCAFGDSLSDFYLFERVGFSVAVNGTAALREKASASYEGQDLLESFHTMLRMTGLR